MCFNGTLNCTYNSVYHALSITLQSIFVRPLQPSNNYLRDFEKEKK